MNPDKTAIEKRYVFNDPSDNACCAHKRVEERRDGELTVTRTWWECVMCGLEFTPKRAALSEVEGERNVDSVHIGTLRRSLFSSLDSSWNALVRDASAEVEHAGENVSRQEVLDLMAKRFEELTTLSNLRIAFNPVEGERWISVKERFPANGEVVLVWFEDEPFPYMDVWKYDGTNRYFRPDSGKNDTSPHQRVTHWQPLPAPPKEKL